MKINDNGVIREMTDAEIDEMKAANADAPNEDMQQRVAALEEELKAAKILLGLEV